MPVIDRGTVVGPVVKQTSPLIMVCGAVLELVKVLETTPYVLVNPRSGASAANAGEGRQRSAAVNPAIAKRFQYLHFILFILNLPTLELSSSEKASRPAHCVTDCSAAGCPSSAMTPK